jgi:flagellar hook assembly protein FlgD
MGGEMYSFSTYLRRTIEATFCLFIAASIACILTACGDNSTGNQIASESGLVAGTHRYQPLQYNLTVQGVSQQGELVPITLTLKNIGSAHIELQGNAEDPGISVYKDNTLVWKQYPPGTALPEYCFQITLDPGESKDFRFIWDQKDNEGNFVAAGNYSITASFSGNTVKAPVLIQ